MTTITPDHADKHGTFTNGEQRFTGTVSYVGPVEVTALIDGAGSVVILPRDNWDFTPDPDLPSAPGFHTDVYGDLWPARFVPARLTVNGAPSILDRSTGMVAPFISDDARDRVMRCLNDGSNSSSTFCWTSEPHEAER